MFSRLGRTHVRRGRHADAPVSSAAEPAESGRSSSREWGRDPTDGQGTEFQQHPSPMAAGAVDRRGTNYVRSTRGGDSPPPNYYKLIGVRRDATTEQLARAYRRYVTLIHPDKYCADPPRQVMATEKLKEINAGMLVLRDPTLRARYDLTLTRFPLSSRLGPVPGEYQQEPLSAAG